MLIQSVGVDLGGWVVVVVGGGGGSAASFPREKENNL